MDGAAHENRGITDGKYVGSGDPGPYGGGTYTGGNEHDETMRQYEEVFGPAARDIRFDSQRSKRHQRWHLPDALKGPNMFLTDRIDGLITDATNSPYTTIILPYKYVENPDAKLKWNVWSFDEGMASRVPYESAARVLTQTKRSFAAYTVRQGLAIAMEHNFMKSPAGMENFRNQVKQMVGSIQYTNDLDVHMALIQAPSYARTIAEKYHTSHRTPQQIVRQYVDLFGIVQKNPNAVDLLIEEAKIQMRNWGSQEPNFLLCNGKLTMQLTMSPEKTNYLTQGIDGVKRLRTGPDIPSYRGVNIIKSRAFSMETNMPPRDVLRRRVRVAEYYYIPANEYPAETRFQFYDQGRDSWVTFSYNELGMMAVNGAQYPAQNNAAVWVDGVERNVIDPAFIDIARYQHNVPRPPAPLPQQAAPMPDAVPQFFTGKADTNISLGNWNIRPYNMKIALLSSVGGLQISHDDTVLHCDTNFSDDEAGFVQVMLQAANFVDTKEMLPYVYCSAMIGGGLFCDTTYHLAKGNSYAIPLCNWAALDARRMIENGGSAIERMFHLDFASRQEPTGDDAYLAQFLPYQPNNYNFTLQNAHGTDNKIDVTTNIEHYMAAVFANTCFTETTIKKLLAQMDVPMDTQVMCHDFIAPFNSKTGISDDDYKNSVRHALEALHSKEFSPYKSVLFGMLMASLHPNRTVRSTMDSLLNAMFGEPWTNSMANTLRSMINAEKTPQALGAVLENMASTKQLTGISFVNTVDRLQGVALNADPNMKKDISNTRLCTIFSLIASKRMFCGAQRFHDGGSPQANGLYGLALLSRTYASLHMNAAKVGARIGQVYADRNRSPPPALHPYQRDINNGLLIVRPNIEHEMLGMILGRGGSDELGATLWGQTELSCFDDSQHGIWGMSYKYHERAQVFNEKNMVRTWDIAFDGYNGGMGTDHLRWDNYDEVLKFKNDTENFSEPYQGVSMLVMAIPELTIKQIPNPVVWYDRGGYQPGSEEVMTDPEGIHKVVIDSMRVTNRMTREQKQVYAGYMQNLPNFADFDRLKKLAGNAASADETAAAGCMAFQGSMRILRPGQPMEEIHGSGHLGPSYVGVAAVREGKGILVNSAPTLQRLV